MPNFDYTVDDEPQTTTEHKLTPVQILQAAGIDPSTHYLVQLQGHGPGEHQVSYKDTATNEINMHERMRFIAISTGATPVS